jgi:hypothetical protein
LRWDRRILKFIDTQKRRNGSGVWYVTSKWAVPGGIFFSILITENQVYVGSNEQLTVFNSLDEIFAPSVNLGKPAVPNVQNFSTPGLVDYRLFFVGLERSGAELEENIYEYDIRNAALKPPYEIKHGPNRRADESRCPWIYPSPAYDDKRIVFCSSSGGENYLICDKLGR